MGMTTDQVIAVEGAGAGRCGVCGGRLDFSWLVRTASGATRTRCSLHVAVVGDSPGPGEPIPTRNETPFPVVDG